MQHTALFSSAKHLIAAAVLLPACAAAFSTAELSAQLQKPQTVQGGFIQERYIKSLAKPMQTGGRFALKSGQGLLWHVQKPIDLRLRVRRDGIAQWDAAAKQWRKSSQSGQAAQVRLFMAVLGGDTAELQKQFTLETTGTPGQWRLVLTPKTPVMKQIFQNITIQGGEFVREVELKEKQGERTVMRFTNPQSGRPLSPEDQNALQ